MTSDLKAVIFDWAGTMVDFGSVAPVMALRDAFDAEGVPVTDAEIRTHMGRTMRGHVATSLPRFPIHTCRRTPTSKSNTLQPQ